MSDCQHAGWVAHAIQGENRFICRECDERFVRHPGAPKSTKFLDALEHIKDFRKGLATFTEACDATKLSAQEFKDSLIGLFGAQEWEPNRATRTSDPEDIEKNLFPTEGVGTSELLEAWRGAWPDIRAMDYHSYNGSRDRETMIILTFIDESKQRLKFSELEIKANANPLVGGSGPLRKFTHPIVRQNYPKARLDDLISKDAF